MRHKRLATWVALVSILAAGCADPFELVKYKNTAIAYRQFINKHPQHQSVSEATRLEAEAALRELGDDPKLGQLKFYLKRFPKSPLFDQVQERVFEKQLSEHAAKWNIKGLGRLLDETKDLPIHKRVKSTQQYLVGSKVAIGKLKRKYFESYLDKKSAGPFAEHARSTIAWMKAVEVKGQETIPVILDGYFSQAEKKHLTYLFRAAKTKPEYTFRIGMAKKYEGKILYRMTKLMPGNTKQIYNDRGEVFEIKAARSGTIVEILTVKDGKIDPLWAWYTLKAAGLKALYFPVISWNTRSAIIAETKAGSTIGEITDFGKYLLVTTLDGFELYDPTFPDRLRLVFRYTRPVGSKGTDLQNRPRVAVLGGLVALFGEGVDLLDCHSLPKIIMNQTANYARVGLISGGAFIGEKFYFTTNSGTLFQLQMDSKTPSPIGMGPYTFVTSDGKRIVVPSEDGIAYYNTSKGAGIGERSFISCYDFPAEFSSDSRVVHSFAKSGGVILVNKRGETAMFHEGTLQTDYISAADLGPVLRLHGKNKWLASIGEAGTSLQFSERINQRWIDRGAVPINGCQGVVMRSPMAYIICGDRIKTVHMKAVIKRR